MTVQNIRGEFWIDDKSFKKTGSFMISDNHEISVYVDGAIFLGKLESLAVTHEELNGYLYNGRHIKVIDPYSLRGFGSKEEDNHEKYFGSEYITSDDDISHPQMYCKMKWSLKGLERWLNIQSYTFNSNHSHNKFEIEHIADLSKFSWNTDIGTVRIFNESNASIKINNIELINTFYMEIIFTEDKNLRECFYLSRVIERFFVTLVNRVNIIPYPSIYDSSGREYNIFYQTYNYETGPSTNLDASSFSFMKDNFGIYLSNYIKLTSNYLSGFFAYPSSFSKGLFIQNKFAHLVTGLEVIHIQLYGLRKNPANRDDDISKFVSKLVDCTKFNSDERRAIRKSFERKYEYNLRERLHSLLTMFEFFDKKTGQTIINNIVDIRNEIMHYGGLKNIESKFSNSEIIKLLSILEVLNIFSIMHVCGIDEEIIYKIYNDSSLYYHPRRIYEGYR